MTSFNKDPQSVETFYVVWVSEDNTNDGGANDSGALQSATIVTAVAQVPSGITLDSENTGSVIISGITYASATVHSMVISGGTAGTNYDITSRITTSDGRTLDKTITLMVRPQ